MINTRWKNKWLATACGAAIAVFGTANIEAGSHSKKSDDKVVLHNASSLMGLDVMTKDGKKVGDISDFAFILPIDGEPSMTHVLITKGAVLGLGGETRAIPVGAIKLTRATAKLDVTSQKLMESQKLGGNHAKFFQDVNQVSKLDDHFDLDSHYWNIGNLNTDFVLYSELNRDEAIGKNGDDLGYITDAWVNLANNKIQFVSIVPDVDPLAITYPYPGQRFAIPMSKYEGENWEGFKFSITESELEDAESIEETDWGQVEWTDVGKVVKIEVASAN